MCVCARARACLYTSFILAKGEDNGTFCFIYVCLFTRRRCCRYSTMSSVALPLKTNFSRTKEKPLLRNVNEPYFFNITKRMRRWRNITYRQTVPYSSPLYLVPEWRTFFVGYCRSRGKLYWPCSVLEALRCATSP